MDLIERVNVKTAELLFIQYKKINTMFVIFRHDAIIMGISA